MKPTARFTLTWMAALAVLSAAVAGFNVLVDPYDVFGLPRHAGFNLLKPKARDHAMLTKTYEIERARPATVLLGSSPVHIGLDASDLAWPDAMRPVFNYGIPGWYSTSTTYATLVEAAATGHVKNAVLLLSFQTFLAPESAASGTTEDERRLLLLPDGTPNPARPRQMATDMFFSLFTMRALTDSVATVFAQRDPATLNLLADGSSTEADLVNFSHSDGMHVLFAQKLALEADRAKGLALGLTAWQGPLPNLEAVSRIIAFCRTHDIALVLMIAPNHSATLELYWRNGLWPRIEQFKTELAGLVAREGEGKVLLWDFNGYDSFTTEPVPPAGDRVTATRWFWEPTHFKKALGTLMLRRIFDHDTAPFGALLTPQTVAARNRDVRAGRERFVCQRDSQSAPTMLAQYPGDECKASAGVAPAPHDPS